MNGCADLPALRQPSQDFYSAASSVYDSEQAYLDAIDTAIGNWKASNRELDFISHRLDYKDVRVPDPGAAQTSYIAADKKIRLDALAALKLYAQQLALVASDETDADVADAAVKLSGKIEKSAAPSLTAQQTGIIAASVTAIANLIVDSRRTADVIKMAKASQKPVHDLARVLGESDDKALETSGLTSIIQTQQADAYSALLKAVYATPDCHAQTLALAKDLEKIWQLHPRSDSQRGLLAVLNSACDAQPATLLTAYDAVMARKITLIDQKKQVNEALAKLVAANDQLASGGTVNFALISKDAERDARNAIAAYKANSQ